MAKTADQMNQERRAAKAKQRAASSARRVAGAKNQEFSLQDAVKAAAKRDQFERQKKQNLADSATSAVEQIQREGSMRIEVNDLPSGSLKSWQEYCFAIITHIRDNKLDLIYNRDWKEVKFFVVGKQK